MTLELRGVENIHDWDGDGRARGIPPPGPDESDRITFGQVTGVFERSTLVPPQKRGAGPGKPVTIHHLSRQETRTSPANALQRRRCCRKTAFVFMSAGFCVLCLFTAGALIPSQHVKSVFNHSRLNFLSQLLLFRFGTSAFMSWFPQPAAFTGLF